MGLIRCPECNAQVSTLAESCPKCGYPIAGGGSTQAHGGKIQTIEQTSKRYKLQQLLSSLLFFGSGIALMVSVSGDQSDSGIAALALLGTVVGFIWYIVVRFMTWWHHG